MISTVITDLFWKKPTSNQFVVIKCKTTNWDEKNNTKTIDDHLKVGDTATKDVVCDDGRDNDNVSNNCSMGDQYSLNAYKSKFSVGVSQNDN